MAAHSQPDSATSGAGLPASLRALRVSGAAPRLRLVSFPYAGGGAYRFRAWAERLPSGIDLYAVQLPGREDRIRDEPFRSLDAAVAAVSGDLVSILDGPFAIFGHSLGAMIGAEVALTLELKLGLTAEHVFVSGSPWLAAIDPDRRPVHNLSDDELIAHIRKLNGTPEQVLANKMIRDLVLRLVRADYAILDGYAYADGRALSCPVTVFGGRSDPTTTPTTLAGWSSVTTGHTDVHLLPGDHFFLHSAEEELLRLMGEALAGR